MDKILNFIHGFFLWTFTLIALFCIDLPLKIILWVLILLLGLVVSIFYPLIKKIELPSCVEVVYDYATTKTNLISKHVYRLWP